MLKQHFGLLIIIWIHALAATAQEHKPDPEVSVAHLLEEARQLYNTMYFQEALSFSAAVTKHENATKEEILAATMLEGSILVVMGNTLAAEKSFIRLLSIQPDYRPPKGASPKILQVYRKVQFDFHSVQAQEKSKELAEKLRQIALFDESSDSGQGGLDYTFHLKVKDENQWIKSIQVNYRKNTPDAFSALALKKSEAENWQGYLPAAWTANEQDYKLEYYLTSIDAQGQSLATLYSSEAPGHIDMRSGSVAEHRSVLERPWFWGVTTGALVTSIGTFIYLNQKTQCKGTCLDFPE